MMPVIQFESAIEKNIIRIPDQYIGQVPSVVTVTLGDVEQLRMKSRMINDRQTHRAAFEAFFAAMAEIDDEPFDDDDDLIKRPCAVAAGN